MSNFKLNQRELILLFSALMLAAGVWLLASNSTNSGNIQHFEKDNVTIIELSKKEKKTDFRPWIGIGLILLSVGLFFTNLKFITKTNLQPLTAKEKEITTLLKKGLLQKEIASELHVSLSTVKTHINHIFKKIGVNSRAELLENLKNREV